MIRNIDEIEVMRFIYELLTCVDNELPENPCKKVLHLEFQLGHPKGVGGLTSNFLRGGGMDVFWNDPIQIFKFCFE